MTFWTTSEGTDLSKQAPKKDYEAPSGSMDPIPDGSTVLAFIKEAKWDNTKQDGSGARYIKVRWDVEQPESVARRVIFQKLFVKDHDPNAKDVEAAEKKRNNALKMLQTIDANARGKLMDHGQEPGDDMLALALSNAIMQLHVKVWEMKGNDGKTMSGNWIAAIHPKGGKDLHVPEVAGGNSGGGGSSDLGDDEIPF